jgi:uncharacterized protein (UPF0332 family)
MVALRHDEAARNFLRDADREFAAGDSLQASEKLWGAATHAIMALAQQRGWDSRSHRALKLAARSVAEEQADDTIRSKFAVAEKCHINFCHGFLEDYEIEEVRPDVQDFVDRVLGLLE